MDFEVLKKKMNEAKGYLLMVSFLHEDGTLDHSFTTKDFLKLNLLPSIKKMREMAIADLEKDDGGGEKKDAANQGGAEIS